MKNTSKIYIAGHNGLTGSAILKKLQEKGYENFILKSHKELDLTNQQAVELFFKKEKPEYVFLCAAKVGGILANNTYRADFIYQNLQIQNNIIHSAYLNNVKKLLFLGTACIYPKNCSQPMKEEDLLTSTLEYTNEPYAIAKIAGLKMCESYNLQYNTNFISVMPCSLYGLNDNFNLEKSHVLPALIRKFHLAKLLSEKRYDLVLKDVQMDDIDQTKEYLQKFGITENEVEIWGTGNARREFLHANDMADACIYVMQNVNFNDLYNSECGEIRNTHINIGSGKDIVIKDLVSLVNKIIGFKGSVFYNSTKPEGTFRKLGSCDKIHSLGWKHKIELEDGIKMMYDWYLEQKYIRG
ncbi:GDP-L-fucose synthase family protein [Campylobacter subantarcticus]|uniref:GDP-L-fucose synthase n=1 Tax=Campylobacter subantarcticus LMG 24374 TaxID=1388751 RepID=A0A0A8HBB3_9BACT|nr:GDP-L-fucose synthase [Campylobacter subantarcticus]AJC90214.1 GDP-L-fucose synthetase [Campylobacter subantarcticus LMG 24374]EAJ1261935.1 GDP-L-fucose synthase [Campylobacter lari]